jgi:hypothetical protein
VERVEYSNTDGSTSEYRATTRYVANEHYTTNTRNQGTRVDTNGHVSLFDNKTHYMLNPDPKVQVTKMNSQDTTTEDGVTCRTNSQVVTTKEETRTQKERTGCHQRAKAQVRVALPTTRKAVAGTFAGRVLVS